MPLPPGSRSGRLNNILPVMIHPYTVVDCDRKSVYLLGTVDISQNPPQIVRTFVGIKPAHELKFSGKFRFFQIMQMTGYSYKDAKKKMLNVLSDNEYFSWTIKLSKNIQHDINALVVEEIIT